MTLQQFIEALIDHAIIIPMFLAMLAVIMLYRKGEFD